MSFDVGSIRARLELDRTSFTTELERAEQQARDFARGTFRVNLDVDNDRFNRGLSMAEIRARNFARSEYAAKLDAEATGFHRAASRAERRARFIGSMNPNVIFDASTGKFDAAEKKVRSQTGKIDRSKADVEVGLNRSLWDRGRALVGRQARTLGMLRPTVVLSAINDPFMLPANAVKRVARQIGLMRPEVQVRAETAQARENMTLFRRVMDQIGTRAARFQGFFGKDGSMTRRIIQGAGAILDLGGHLNRLRTYFSQTSAQAATSATRLGMVGTEAAASGTLLSTLGTGLWGVAAAAGAAALSIGPLLVVVGLLGAAVWPLIGMLGTAGATVAALGIGFGLAGAAATMFAMDAGKVRAANERVADATIAVNEARKAANNPAYLQAEKQLTNVKRQQEKAEKRLSAAYDAMKTKKDPTATRRLAAAEKNLSKIKQQQTGIERRLSAAYDTLNKARKSGNPRQIAAAERQLNSAQNAQTAISRKLDKAYATLNKERDASKPRRSAGAERELAAAQKNSEKWARRVEQAQKKVNEARKTQNPERLREAEKELARAQNQSAIAANEAAHGSARYRKALQKIEGKLPILKKEFQKAFTPAATRLAEISAGALDLASKKMPALGKSADRSIAKMTQGYNNSYKSSNKYRGILDQIPGIMGEGARAAGNFGSAFNSFMRVALPYVNKFVTWVADGAEKLARWADSEQGRKQINQFFRMAIPLARSVWNFITRVGKSLWDLGVQHGPKAARAFEWLGNSTGRFIDLCNIALDVVGWLIDKMKTLFDWAGRAIAQINQLAGARNRDSARSAGNHSRPPRRKAYGGDEGIIGMARGGDVRKRETRAETKKKMASGGDLGTPLWTAASSLSFAGAHYVRGPRMGTIGDTSVLYGEALSGTNREYAFPLDGGYRFITEQPGFDQNSFALWRDLGERKGYFPETVSGPAVGGGPSTGVAFPALSATPRSAGVSASAYSYQGATLNMPITIQGSTDADADEMERIAHQKVREAFEHLRAQNRNPKTKAGV